MAGILMRIAVDENEQIVIMIRREISEEQKNNT